MATVLKGAPVAELINTNTSKAAEDLKSRGISPTLAIVRIGANDGDLSYERGAIKRASAVGTSVVSVAFPADVTAEEYYAKLDELNADPAIHGILLLRPVPAEIGDEKARNYITPAKDVDGCSDASLAGIFAGTKTGFAPCTAQAAMEILHFYDIDPCGKRAAIFGRSLVVGRPLAMMLMNENATPTICHTKTPDAAAICRASDIIIAAIGKAYKIGAEYAAPGQTIVDVGINWDEEKGKLCGDVDYDAVVDTVAAITPVPGGVGAVTTAVLMNHVVEAAAKS